MPGDAHAKPGTPGWSFVHVSSHHELRNWYSGDWFGFCEHEEPGITQAYLQQPASILAQPPAKAISPSFSGLQSFLETSGSFT